MAQVAAHAGVDVGTLYRHFATREDLLGALVHRSFAIAPATRQLKRTSARSCGRCIERGQANGELRADLTPEDVIVATSLVSRPLAGTEPALVAEPGSDWDRVAARQIELVLHGLGARRAGTGKGPDR